MFSLSNENDVETVSVNTLSAKIKVCPELCGDRNSRKLSFKSPLD
jgi:hypothetical protein